MTLGAATRRVDRARPFARAERWGSQGPRGRPPPTAHRLMKVLRTVLLTAAALLGIGVVLLVGGLQGGTGRVWRWWRYSD